MLDTQTQAFIDMATAVNRIANNTPSSKTSGLDLQTHALLDIAEGLKYIADNGGGGGGGESLMVQLYEISI